MTVSYPEIKIWMINSNKDDYEENTIFYIPEDIEKWTIALSKNGKFIAVATELNLLIWNYNDSLNKWIIEKKFYLKN